MPFEPHIREGRRSDAENLAALALQVWLHTYATQGISSLISRYVLSEFTPQRFDSLLTSGSATILVAESGAHLVGYALVGFGAPCPIAAKSEVELATLYVQEHFAGKGVGRTLLLRAQALAGRRTGQPLWLTVNAKNDRAITFYARHGYRNIGVAAFRLGDEDHENHVLIGEDARWQP